MPYNVEFCRRIMRFLLSYSLAIVWAIIVAVLLLMPSSSFDEVSIPMFYGMDKLVHCGIFFVLTVLIYYGNSRFYMGSVNKFLSLFVVFLVAVVFAILTELGQLYLTDSRSADMWDIAANFIGIGMAAFAYLCLYRDVNRVRKQRAT